MAKSPDAFRTISEVADWLGIQAHVLRFWESKFSQVKPIKRAGGRRYYRPTDMLLLGGIKKLLHDDGLTIKGVQKILREQGMNHVADMSAPLDDDTLAQLDDVPKGATPDPAPAEEEEKGVVLTFEPPAEEQNADDVAADAAEPDPAQTSQESAKTPQEAGASQDADVPEMHAGDTADVDDTSQPEDVAKGDTAPEVVADADSDPQDATAPEEATFAGDDEEHAATLPAFLQRPLDTPPAEAADEQAPEPVSEAPEEMEPVAATPDQADMAETLPEADKDRATDSTASEQDAPVAAEPAPKPRVIDVPAVPAEADIDAAPGLLAATFARKAMSSAEARDAAPLVARLASLRDSMNAQRRNTGVSS